MGGGSQVEEVEREPQAEGTEQEQPEQEAAPAGRPSRQALH